VNGHGADNQRGTLDRMCREFNSGFEPKRVMWVYPGFPRSLVAGAIGHAASEETSMLEAMWPGSTDVSKLPATGKLHNVDFAIVDGDTFDCVPTPDKTLREAQDPRVHSDSVWGAQQVEMAAHEVIADIKALWFKSESK
jgi:creatinine amidohydrolase/Fe(II)-dependent formamide hydrolase-like protein